MKQKIIIELSYLGYEPPFEIKAEFHNSYGITQIITAQRNYKETQLAITTIYQSGTIHIHKLIKKIKYDNKKT